MEDGIYFNLDDELYHKENRLSSSGIRDILESPSNFWFKSNFNPLKKEPKSDALKDGRIFHSMVLEGNNFHNKYKVMPLEIEGLSKNSNDFKLWSSTQTLEIIPYQKFKQFDLIIKYLSEKGQILYNNVFKDGYPEVSIFWTEDNIKRKARIDYLKASSYNDLKTYIKTQKSPIDDYVKRYFFTYRVYIQMIYYDRALKNAVNLPVFGSSKQKDFWEKTKNNPRVPMVAFINRELPQARIKVFSQEACPDLWRLGEKQISQAEFLYLDYLDKYGEKRAWLENVETENLLFKDEDFPQSFYELLTGNII